MGLRCPWPPSPPDSNPGPGLSLRMGPGVEVGVQCPLPKTHRVNDQLEAADA